MQVIYKATHLPTNKPYIGYKANADKLSSYKTSSKIVNPMMTANPHEWKMEPIVFILPNVDAVEAMRLEQEVIKQYFDDLGGWDGIWNQTIGYGFEYSLSPEAVEKRRAATRSEEYRQNTKERFANNPELGEAHSLRMAVYWADQEARDAQSQRTTSYFANNPGAVEANRQRGIEQFSKPGAREAMSLTKKESHINNPQIAKAQGLKLKEFYVNNPEELAAMSKRAKERHANDPGIGEAHSLFMKEHCAKPEVKEALSQRAIAHFAKPGAREAMSKIKKAQLAKPGAREALSQAGLKASGKTIEVTFKDGEVLTHFGMKSLAAKLGARHLGEMANGTAYRRKDGCLTPIKCKSPQYAGRIIVSARYV